MKRPSVEGTIEVTELRASLSHVLRRARRGERITVVDRGRPVFQIVPLTGTRRSKSRLERDPLFHAKAIGRSRDGGSAGAHDGLLYEP